MTLKNKPQELQKWIDQLRPKALSSSKQLQDDLTANPPAALMKALKAYEKRNEALKKEFIKGRAIEYSKAREIEQKQNIAAEEAPVGSYKPRKTNHAYATYNAPDRMNYDSIDLQQVAAYGKTSSEISVPPGEKTVTVHLTARSQYVPDGRSRIEVSPKVTWEFDDPETLSSKDWDEIKPSLFNE